MRSAALDQGPIGSYLALLVELTRKDLRVRYKGSYLGYVWSILNPLALAAVFFVAFSLIMRVKIEHYAFFLIVGLFPWQWFSNSLNVGSTVYISNMTLIKKVNIHRSLLPLSTVCNDMLHFIVALPVTFAVGIYFGKTPSSVLLVGLPAVMLCQFMITYGITLVVSGVNPFFRDMERLTGVAMMIMFYCTPIVYSMEMVPDRMARWFLLNPMAPVIASYDALFRHQVFPYASLGLSFVWGLVSLLIGFSVHRLVRLKLAEVL